MPVNINSVGSSGIGSGSNHKAVQEYAVYTDKLTSSLNGVDFDTLSTNNVFTWERSGSANVQYPKYPSVFTDFKNALYGNSMADSGDNGLYDINIQWPLGSTNGNLVYTKKATIGVEAILDRASIGNYMYIIGESRSDAYEKYARLYRYDGTSVTDIFGKDMIYLADIYGNTTSSDYYVEHDASSRYYYISPVVKTNGGATDDMIVVATYYDGSYSTNETKVYWYYIESLATTPKVKYVIYVGNKSKWCPGSTAIFTDSGNMISSTTYNKDNYSYRALFTGSYKIVDNNGKLSVSLTDTNNIEIGRSVSLNWSNLSEPLNNNYLVTPITGYDRSSQQVYHITVNDGEIVTTNITVSIPQLNVTESDQWGGLCGCVTFKYTDPCVLVSYETSGYSSDYYYVNVSCGKINSSYTVKSNDGNYALTGYFRKGDTVYSDDGIYSYTTGSNTTTYSTDTKSMVIQESGIYTIHTRCSKIYPLDVPPVVIKTSDGILKHLGIVQKSSTEIQANLTSNVSVNNAEPKYGIQTYKSSNSDFLFSLK